jgi:hypothetical protein
LPALTVGSVVALTLVYPVYVLVTESDDGRIQEATRALLEARRDT